jgi:alanine-glyoxylate transaminase/serine-glyoxylate transaminase/serine-pyruvate transaminase
MDMAVCNLLQPGERVLVLDHGTFGARMADIARRYGGEVSVLTAPPGEVVALDALRAALVQRPVKLVAVTQVDTSTGVIADVRGVAALAREHGALCVVDGVCATGGAEFRQDAWDVDVCFTASQKAMGVPPGLALLMFGPRALEAFRARNTPVANYYGDLGNWLPIMQAYQERRPAYFATPPVNLIYALDESVRQILAQGMEARFQWHARVGAAFRAMAHALGLRSVPVSDAVAAPTLSALYYPDGLGAPWLARVKKRGVVLAGFPQIRERYFRIGTWARSRAATCSPRWASRARWRRGLREQGAGLRAAAAALEAGRRYWPRSNWSMITLNAANGVAPLLLVPVHRERRRAGEFQRARASVEPACTTRRSARCSGTPGTRACPSIWWRT